MLNPCVHVSRHAIYMHRTRVTVYMRSIATCMVSLRFPRSEYATLRTLTKTIFVRLRRSLKHRSIPCSQTTIAAVQRPLVLHGCKQAPSHNEWMHFLQTEQGQPQQGTAASALQNRVTFSNIQKSDIYQESKDKHQ